MEFDFLGIPQYLNLVKSTNQSVLDFVTWTTYCPISEMHYYSPLLGIYKPNPVKEYTEDSAVQPFDYMSNLVKEWELAAKIHADTEKKCRQVILRSGQCCHLLAKWEESVYVYEVLHRGCLKIFCL